MNINEFMNVMEANSWKTRLMAIIFDNSMRYLLNQREMVWDDKTHCWKSGRYLTPEEQLIIDRDNETLAMIQQFQSRDMSDKNADKWRFKSVAHVENVQRMVFCDEGCEEIRPYFDANMM